MKEENVAIRLKDFIEEMGLTNSQFADQCGIPRPSLSQILTGRNKKISDVIVGQIHHAFPNLSVLWLLFGEGSMVVQEDKEDEMDEDLPNLFSESGKFSTPGKEQNKYSNLNALNDTVNRHKATVNNVDSSDFKVLDLQNKIEQMRKNPRKVVQITVYYDDSTFETFSPD